MPMLAARKKLTTHSPGIRILLLLAASIRLRSICMVDSTNGCGVNMTNFTKSNGTSRLAAWITLTQGLASATPSIFGFGFHQTRPKRS